MSSSKKLTYKGTVRQVFIRLRLEPTYPPPLNTVYVYTVYLGGGGRVEPERKGERQQLKKLGRKYQNG
jgi:hypothetical protein